MKPTTKSSIPLTSSLLLLAANSVKAQDVKINGYTTIGDTGVSGQFFVHPKQCLGIENKVETAQQLFLGTEKTVYIVDKTENNPITVGDPAHPAWASSFSLDTKKATAMDIRTNSFCAGGAVLGNGTWVNAGGNQPITTNGVAATANTEPYYDYDGGLALRVLDPCDDGSCSWVDNSANYMQSRRWYPTLETLQDGSLILIGGDFWGGFVNGNDQNNPTVEYFPSKGTQVNVTLLVDAMPANLYSLTWLVPSGRLFIQTGWLSALYDWEKNVETRLPNITHAVRVYPSSAGQAMLPLRPSNNYDPTILFCGGMDVADNEWKANTVDWFRAKEASTSCVTIQPEADNPQYVDDDDLAQGRVMGNLILLPDGTLFLTNGVSHGVAGYNDSNVPYSNPADAILAPAIYDPKAKSGSRWTTQGLGNLNSPRIYHSTATLLADGSVLIAGSNPYVDFVPQGTAGKESFSQTSAEVFYPWYFNYTRPAPTGIPDTISYGGNSYDIQLKASESYNMDNTEAICIRTGFSTHAQNFGQRFIQFNSTFTRNSDGSATMHVSQAPPNPSIFPPGPCLYFVVSDGVPSIGKMVMIGNGQIGTQPTSAAAVLPASSGQAVTGPTTGHGSGASSSGGSNGGSSGSNSGSGNGGNSAASTLKVGMAGVVGAFAIALLL
ncbi:copper radical oxidase [Atractiella rhizophila]|nr:copper radical oxidase [Atractiella rhizophila]